MRLLFLLLTVPAWAKSPCPDSDAKELARVRVSPSIQLLACGSRPPPLNDLMIYKLGGGTPERLMDGDAVMKTYKLKTVGKTFEVLESLSGDDFKPFISLQVSCKGAQCSAQDRRCVWKKGKADETALTAIATPDPVADSTWTMAFVAALNGSEKARQIFKGEGVWDPEAAEHSERFSTYRADLKRLQDLGCFK